jgi:8-oxo-dGTP pyrophosphatase MutT (NUDIX family)
MKPTPQQKPIAPQTPTPPSTPQPKEANPVVLENETQWHGKQPRPRVSKSVGAIVLNNSFHTLLLFQRKNTYWEFPKGKMEPGEREIDTLQREIFEETGIRKFRMVKGFRKVMHYDFRYKGQRIRRKVVYFLVKTGDRVRISDEHSEYLWLPLDRAKSRLKHTNQITLIDEVIRRIYG